MGRPRRVCLPESHGRDGWQLVLAPDRSWPIVHPKVVVDRSPSEQVVHEREPINQIRQKRCRRDWSSCAPWSSLCEGIFVEGLGIGCAEILSKDLEAINESTKSNS